MVGVNCSKPEHIVSLIRDIKQETNLPVGVYPNSGDIYDPTTKTWEKVGGCCTTTCTHIEQVVKARDAFRAQAVSTKDKNER